MLGKARDNFIWLCLIALVALVIYFTPRGTDLIELTAPMWNYENNQIIDYP